MSWTSRAEHVLELLVDLCALPAPSGQEDAVRAKLTDAWTSRVDVLEVDAIGNVIGRVGGSGPRLVVHAHMDEISWVVRHVRDDGFVLLDAGQGLRREGPQQRHMVGHHAVVVGNDGSLTGGLFVAPAGHVLTPEQLANMTGWDDFFLDVGLASRADVESRGIHVGAGVAFAPTTRRVGNRIAGKAIDDRVGLAIIDLLLDTVDRAGLAYELWVAATVQEENGLHGARALAASRAFDLALGLDVGLVGDVPGVGLSEFDACLGGGPTIVYKDSLVFYDRRLNGALLGVARQDGITLQAGVYAGYAADGVPFIDAGVPSALVGIPTRYTHTPFELVDPSDILGTVDVLSRFVATVGPFHDPAARPAHISAEP